MIWSFIGGATFVGLWWLLLHRATAREESEPRVVKAWRNPTNTYVTLDNDRIRRFTHEPKDA